MAYKILFFVNKQIRGDFLKEIGELLRETREEIGISTEEVATDLKVSPSQIENIEIGNREVFTDVFELKKIMRDYAKYLNLDPDKIEDEFNEFVFVYTSKIPVEEIAKANKEIQKKQELKKTIRSPYTKFDTTKKSKLLPIIITITILLILLGIIYLVLSGDKEALDREKRIGVYYEFPK